MKTLLRIAVLVLTVARVTALAPGDYLISCARLKPEGGSEMHACPGYLLSIGVDGEARLTVAAKRLSQDTKITVESVQLIQGDRAEAGHSFVLSAKYIELYPSGEKVTYVVTLGFEGEIGRGVESKVGFSTYHLTGFISPIESAEQGAVSDPPPAPGSTEPENE